MKHLEQIVVALKSLTERYGITITEVPERLREKVLAAAGSECSTDLDTLLQPLLLQFLRPIRVRAGHKIGEKAVREVVEQTAALEGFSPEKARRLIDVWLDIFKVKVVAASAEDAEREQFTSLDQNFKIEDVVTLTVDERVETVYNPFDAVSKVVEPQVADFDGKFDDYKSENVTDFSISDAENKISESVESFAAPVSAASKDRLPDSQAVENTAKSRRSKSVAPTQAGFDQSTAVSSGAASTKHTIDDAFRQLRNNNFEMASKIMMELARNGNSKAQFHLGEFYLMGTGVEISEDKAKYWFRKAAAQGSMPARQKIEDLESNKGSGSCFGCFFAIFMVFISIKLLSILAGL